MEMVDRMELSDEYLKGMIDADDEHGHLSEDEDVVGIVMGLIREYRRKIVGKVMTDYDRGYLDGLESLMDDEDSLYTIDGDIKW